MHGYACIVAPIYNIYQPSYIATYSVSTERSEVVGGSPIAFYVHSSSIRMLLVASLVLDTNLLR